MIAEDLWRGRFRADAAAIGSTVRVNGSPRTIVGVMPARFAFPVNAKAWLPMTEVSASTNQTSQEDALRIAGRLRPSSTLDAASNEVRSCPSPSGRTLP